jgi:NhaP-type Na+/H+ or K+/H+ antiporter
MLETILSRYYAQLLAVLLMLVFALCQRAKSSCMWWSLLLIYICVFLARCIRIICCLYVSVMIKNFNGMELFKRKHFVK